MRVSVNPSFLAFALDGEWFARNDVYPNAFAVRFSLPSGGYINLGDSQVDVYASRSTFDSHEKTGDRAFEPIVSYHFGEWNTSNPTWWESLRKAFNVELVRLSDHTYRVPVQRKDGRIVLLSTTFVEIYDSIDAINRDTRQEDDKETPMFERCIRYRYARSLKGNNEPKREELVWGV